MKTVLKCTNHEIKKIINFYRDYAKEPANDYIMFLAKTKYLTVNVYSSNKVVFQGQDATEEYTMWRHLLNKSEPQTKKTVTPASTSDFFVPSIGSDEVGKGDFFGPVIVCAAYLDPRHKETLKELKLTDSKQLSDDYISSIGPKLVNLVTYSLLKLPNKKYNDLYMSGMNINKLLAYMHNKALLNVKKQVDSSPKIYIDQFTPKASYYKYLSDEKDVLNDIIFLTKAEEQIGSVALGSVIARYHFIKEFDKLSEETGFHLQKGAGKEVDKIAARIIKHKGEAFLQDIAKVNFKTLDKAKALVRTL
ncbi:MAG: ribonuclease HIII [Candidatus Izimaplasma sp.]|nr:ribonuclease HIII [Candidatus Izimaplasma bacterium]